MHVTVWQRHCPSASVQTTLDLEHHRNFTILWSTATWLKQTSRVTSLTNFLGTHFFWACYYIYFAGLCSLEDVHSFHIDMFLHVFATLSFFFGHTIFVQGRNWDAMGRVQTCSALKWARLDPGNSEWKKCWTLPFLVTSVPTSPHITTSGVFVGIIHRLRNNNKKTHLPSEPGAFVI